MSTINPASSAQTPAPLDTTGELEARNPQSKPDLIGKLTFGKDGYVNLLKLGDGTIGVQSADPKRQNASKIYTLNTGKAGQYSAKYVFPVDLSDAKARVQHLVKKGLITLFPPSSTSKGVNLGDLGSAVLSVLSGKKRLTPQQQQAVDKVEAAAGKLSVLGVPLNQIPKVASGAASTVNRMAKYPVLPTGDPASSVTHARGVANNVIKTSDTFHSLADLASVPGSAGLDPKLADKVAEANQIRAKINAALKSDSGAVSGGFNDWKTLLTPAERKKLDSLQVAVKANLQVRTATGDPSRRQSFLTAFSGSLRGSTLVDALPVTSRTPLSSHPATQIPLVSNGDEVKKGQILAKVSSPTLDQDESKAKETLQVERGNAASAFLYYQASTRPQQAQLKNADAGILAAQQQVKLQQLQVERYSSLVSEGALAPFALTQQQQSLEVAKQNLNTQIEQRANLQAQIRTQALPAGMTAESFVKQAESGAIRQASSHRYPDSLITAATNVFNAKKAIDALASERESMTLRAPEDGTVASVQLASSATTTGGANTATGPNSRPSSYGLGFTIIPKGQPALGLDEVNPKDAALFRDALKSGSRVTIQDSVTGEFGSAQVGAVFPSPTANEGYKVVLKDPKIGEKPIDVRSVYRVYSSNTSPSTLKSQSSNNVSYSPPSAVVASVDKLGFVTQAVEVKVPIFSDRTNQQIGELEVNLVGTTNGQTLKLEAGQTQAYFIANSGKNRGVPILQSISPNAILSFVGPARTGAKTGVPDSAAQFSMQSIVVPDGTNLQHSSAVADGISVPISVSVPDVASVGITPSKTITDTTGRSVPGVPSTATASFVVVPTGGGLIGQGSNALSVVGLPSKIVVHDPGRL